MFKTIACPIVFALAQIVVITLQYVDHFLVDTMTATSCVYLKEHNIIYTLVYNLLKMLHIVAVYEANFLAKGHFKMSKNRNYRCYISKRR